MPGGDRTGPMGMGPMTGRGLGLCTGAATQGAPPRGFFGRGRGLGQGRGGGRGRRNMFYATGQPGWARADTGALDAGETSPPPAETPAEELAVLKQQAQQAAASLAYIQQRIGELEGEACE